MDDNFATFNTIKLYRLRLPNQGAIIKLAFFPTVGDTVGYLSAVVCPGVRQMTILENFACFRHYLSKIHAYLIGDYEEYLYKSFKKKKEI